MQYQSLLLILLFLFTLAACGGDSESNNGTANNGTSSDTGGDAGSDAADEDVPSIGDISESEDLEHRCGDALVTDWPLNEAVSTETVSATTADGVTTLEVVATAGGSTESATNPFIYVDLEAGEKVELDDIAAHSSTDWDLAFKRYIIRANGADSGAGDVSVAKLSDTTFDAVTEAPQEASAWEQDVSYDENCEPLTDPIGSLMTAFNHLNPTKNSGSWYEYPGLSPTAGEVYVIDVPSKQKTYKLQIESWEDGVFSIKLADL